MGRQVLGGADGLGSTTTGRSGCSHLAPAPVDVVPLPRARRMATKLARVWIHLRQEAASGELSPRSPAPPPPPDPRLAHPSSPCRQASPRGSRLHVVLPPDDAA